MAMLAATVARGAVVFSDNFNSYTPGQANADASFTAVYTSQANPAITASGGLGNSQALSFTADATEVRTSPAIDLVNGDPVGSVSIYFQYVSGAGVAAPQIGFTAASNGGFTGAGDVSGRVSSNKLELRYNNASLAAGSTLSFTAGNWYQLVFTAERTATVNLFNLAVSLYNSDSAGVVGSRVDTLATPVTTVATGFTYNDSSIFAAVRENSTIVFMDNFAASQSAAVPEPAPATAALLGGLALAGVGSWRWKRAHG